MSGWKILFLASTNVPKLQSTNFQVPSTNPNGTISPRRLMSQNFLGLIFSPRAVRLGDRPGWRRGADHVALRVVLRVVRWTKLHSIKFLLLVGLPPGPLVQKSSWVRQKKEFVQGSPTFDNPKFGELRHFLTERYRN